LAAERAIAGGFVDPFLANADNMMRWAAWLGLLLGLAGCAPHRPLVAGDAAPPPQPDAIAAWRIIGLERAPPSAFIRPVAPAPPAPPPVRPERTVVQRGDKIAAPAPRRGPKLLYSTCPTVPLTYCLGEIRATDGVTLDNLPPDQVKSLRRCDGDIYARAFDFFTADLDRLPGEAGVLQDLCARDMFKSRTVAEARQRLAPAAIDAPPLAENRAASKINE
jgi:hypothetical protein